MWSEVGLLVDFPISHFVKSRTHSALILHIPLQFFDFCVFPFYQRTPFCSVVTFIQREGGVAIVWICRPAFCHEWHLVIHASLLQKRLEQDQLKNFELQTLCIWWLRTMPSHEGSMHYFCALRFKDFFQSLRTLGGWLLLKQYFITFGNKLLLFKIL